MPTPIFNTVLLPQGTNQSVITTPVLSGYGIVTCRLINHNTIDGIVDLYATDTITSPPLDSAIVYQHPLPSQSQITIDTIFLPNQKSIVARASIDNISIAVDGLYYSTRNSFLVESTILLSATNVVDISHLASDVQYGIVYTSIYNNDNIPATVTFYASQDSTLNNGKMLLKDYVLPPKTYTQVLKGLSIPPDYKLYAETTYPNLIVRSIVLVEQ